MSYKPTQSEKNDAYGRGIDDARKGKFNPPKSDPLVDFICAPLDALAGTPSTKEVAAWAESSLPIWSLLWIN